MGTFEGKLGDLMKEYMTANPSEVDLSTQLLDISSEAFFILTVTIFLESLYFARIWLPQDR